MASSLQLEQLHFDMFSFFFFFPFFFFLILFYFIFKLYIIDMFSLLSSPADFYLCLKIIVLKAGWKPLS